MTETISCLYKLLDLQDTGTWNNDGTFYLNRPYSSATLSKLKYRSFSSNVKSSLQNVQTPNLNCDLCANIEILNETSTAPDGIASITTDELSGMPKKLATQSTSKNVNSMTIINQTGLKEYNNVYNNVIKLANYTIPLNYNINDSISIGLDRAKIELIKILGLLPNIDKNQTNYNYTSFYNGSKPSIPGSMSSMLSSQMFLTDKLSVNGRYRYLINPITTGTKNTCVLSCNTSNPYTFSKTTTEGFVDYVGVCVDETDGVVHTIGGSQDGYHLPTQWYVYGNNPIVMIDLTTKEGYKAWLSTAQKQYDNNRTVFSYGFYNSAKSAYVINALLYKGSEPITNYTTFLNIRKAQYITQNQDKYLFATFAYTGSTVEFEDHTPWFMKMLQALVSEFSYEMYLTTCAYVPSNNNTYFNILYYAKSTREIKNRRIKMTGATNYGYIKDDDTIKFDSYGSVGAASNFLKLSEENEFYHYYPPYTHTNTLCYYYGESNGYVLIYLRNLGNESYKKVNNVYPNTVNINILNDNTVNIVQYSNNEYTISKINPGSSSWSQTTLLTNSQIKSLLSKYDQSSINPYTTSVDMMYVDNVLCISEKMFPNASQLWTVFVNASDIPDGDTYTSDYTLSNSLIQVNTWDCVMTPYLPTINEAGSNNGYNWINSEHITPDVVDNFQYIYYNATEADNFIDKIFKWDQTNNTITFPNIPIYGKREADGKTVYGNLLFYITFSTSPEVISFDPNIKQGLRNNCSSYYSIYKQVLNKTPSLYLQQYNFDDYFIILDHDYYNRINTYLALITTDLTLNFISPEFPTINNCVFQLNESSLVDFKESKPIPSLTRVSGKLVDAGGNILLKDDAQKLYSNLTICIDWEFIN